MIDYVISLLSGLVPAAVLALPIFKGLLALKARQTVSQHVAEHAHKQGTPTMGGLMILAGLVPALAGYSLLVPSDPALARVSGVLALVLGYALIGFVDDFVIPRLMKGKRGLGWTQKLLMQIGIAAGSVYLLGPTSLGALGFAVLCILFFSNAYNFTDGLDWLAATVLMALAGGIAALAHLQGATTITHLMVLLVGATLPFMVFNRPPAKIFMGDVGSMPIGGLLGICVASLAWPATAPSIGMPALIKLNQIGGGVVFAQLGTMSLDPRPLAIWGALFVMSFVMFAELLPPPLQIASVKLRKKRLFPMTPIHHAYQKAGWKETRIVAMFFAVQLVCSLLGLAIAFAASPPANDAGVEMVR